ncbi:methionyl-tRNA formyltransferase [Patescibacteria group bacterium]|nr:methionyl-tRNA formyltransferase [Patescibacteria group bacterium]
MILPLAKHSALVWKQKFKNIPKITPEIKNLVSDMRETLEVTSGVGLAAPQVNAPLRIFIADYGRMREVFINPKVTRYGKEANSAEEGCLSIPRVRGKVNRATEIEINYIDLKGMQKRAQLAGYFSRIVQHEYDHLSSTFYTDRIPDKKKIYTYEPIKIVFFGTPKFGSTILKTLYGQQLVGEYSIELVVTAADKPAGRGKQPTSSEVKKMALQFKLPVVSPNSIKDPKFTSQLIKLEPDFMVLASYGKIIPKKILTVPKKKAVNVHPSLLPKYRGASPITAALLNGDKTTGVTIMKMNEKMDEGDVLATAKLRISSKDTAESLSLKLADVGAKLIHHVLHLAATAKIKPKPQNHKKATYTKQMQKEDGRIIWNRPPKNLEAMIRAYYPWPAVWTKYEGKILKLLPERKVQLEGKQPVTLKEFRSGHQDFNLNW